MLPGVSFAIAVAKASMDIKAKRSISEIVSEVVSEAMPVSKVVSVSKEMPKLQRPKLVTDQCLFLREEGSIRSTNRPKKSLFMVKSNRLNGK